MQTKQPILSFCFLFLCSLIAFGQNNTDRSNLYLERFDNSQITVDNFFETQKSVMRLDNASEFVLIKELK